MSPESIRTRGWVLLLLGSLLTAGMVYLIALIAGIMQNSGNPDATIRFDGDGLDGMMVFGVLGLVLVIAMTIVVAGIWQIKYSRRNPRIVRAMLWLVGGFILIGAIVRLIG